MSLLTDKYNFWNIGTYACIFIFLLICLSDIITTLLILSIKGGVETNLIIVPISRSSTLLLLAKLIEIIIITFLIKFTYDTIQTHLYTIYNKLSVYIMFAIPAGVTLAIVLHNCRVLSYV